MLKKLSLFLAAPLTVVTFSFAQAQTATCKNLSAKLGEARERLFYARNAWQNRQALCEADLNPPQCHEYFKNDYLAAKNQLSVAKRDFKAAGCTQD